MRAVKRWWRRRRAERKIAGRRREIEQSVASVLGQPVRFQPAGSSGRDSIYQVHSENDDCLGMVRLANPTLPGQSLPDDSPFIWTNTTSRLEREWRSYHAGAAAGLTPQPLWRTGDALLCRYVPLIRLSDQRAAEPGRVWEFLNIGARGVSHLHDLGLTHMDVCFANILTDPEGQETCFIDFEYAPAPHLSPREQRAYDYLRLLESTLKFIPVEGQSGVRDWATLVASLTDEETRAAPVQALKPALERLLARGYVRHELANVFRDLRSGGP